MKGFTAVLQKECKVMDLTTVHRGNRHHTHLPLNPVHTLSQAPLASSLDVISFVCMCVCACLAILVDVISFKYPVSDRRANRG